MKAKRKNEELVKFHVRIPTALKEQIQNIAISERRSINDQTIILLESAVGRQKEAGINQQHKKGGK